MIPVNVRIFVCIEPVDMRSRFDRLALLARDKLQQDPRSGALLIFTGRRRDRLKALWWDRNGYCILYKRFHQSVFELPVRALSGSTWCGHLDALDLQRWIERVQVASV